MEEYCESLAFSAESGGSIAVRRTDQMPGDVKVNWYPELRRSMLNCMKGVTMSGDNLDLVNKVTQGTISALKSSRLRVNLMEFLTEPSPTSSQCCVILKDDHYSSSPGISCLLLQLKDGSLALKVMMAIDLQRLSLLETSEGRSWPEGLRQILDRTKEGFASADEESEALNPRTIELLATNTFPGYCVTATMWKPADEEAECCQSAVIIDMSMKKH